MIRINIKVKKNQRQGKMVAGSCRMASDWVDEEEDRRCWKQKELTSSTERNSSTSGCSHTTKIKLRYTGKALKAAWHTHNKMKTFISYNYYVGIFQN